MTDPHWPTVTVVTPTRGRPHLLPRAIQAVLDQRYPGPIESVVVFDREEPYRPEVVLPFLRDLRLLPNARVGPAGAYNTGILAASGEVVAICDDDDEWLPDKLRIQVEALRRHPEAAVAVTGLYVCGERTQVRVPRKERLTLQDVLRSPRSELHMSTFAAPRENFFDRIGLFDETIPQSYGEDLDWLVRATRIGPILAIRQPLVRVNVSPSYYRERWELILEAIMYQLPRVPAYRWNHANRARMYGRMAFAHAALGQRAEARTWARRSIGTDWRQPRGYLALLVSFKLVRPEAVVRLARAAGRGI